MDYDPAVIEKKWQERWTRENAFDVDVRTLDDPFYVLTMFPYPSGDRLHIGHWFQYGVADSWTRFQKLRGKEVFQPMGFDAFGLPAENHAVKTGVHPADSTRKNVEDMKSQYRRMGVGYAWDYTLDTSDPAYYRWTQWLFLLMHERGLAYRKKAPVNWCPSCMTVLANEQAAGGTCERCGTAVLRRELEQWFFRITAYADELLSLVDSLEWPEPTKAMQRNWIGRSEGMDVEFRISGAGIPVTVFTTRPDTICGVTFIALAPEHPDLEKIVTPEKAEEVRAYRERSMLKNELERMASDLEKTGVFTGAFAEHPVTGEPVPVWIADYVLGSYGTGAVMGVPAHDERDYAFSLVYGLPVRRVVIQDDPVGTGPGEGAGTAGAAPVNPENGPAAVPVPATGYGTVTNSGAYDGLTSEAMIEALARDLEPAGRGRRAVRYRLRDWLVSRQRYWGAPIPIVYCDRCGIVPVRKADLPVLLPYDVEFRPDGISPLVKSEEFLSTACPRCGGPARRETDTLDTFVCSSWYYLRFPSVAGDGSGRPERPAGNEVEDPGLPFDPELTGRVLPVDLYCGGPEHACLHLLYARFVTKVFRDAGFLRFGEPFPRLVHQGLILGPDGQKMSKSRGNAVSPDPIVERFGADALRMFLLFGFEFSSGGPWEDGGIRAVSRFLNRLWRLFESHADEIGPAVSEAHDAGALAGGSRTLLPPESTTAEGRALLKRLAVTVREMTRDMERFRFNTAVARLMELYAAAAEYDRTVSGSSADRRLVGCVLTTMILLVAPMAPHFAEEWWERAGGGRSVFFESWPEPAVRDLENDFSTVAVMINGKRRGEVSVPVDAGEEAVLSAARAQPGLLKYLEAGRMKRTVYVPGRILSIVTET